LSQVFSPSSWLASSATFRSIANRSAGRNDLSCGKNPRHGRPSSRQNNLHWRGSFRCDHEQGRRATGP
jgi:hypothetical protein